MKALNDKQLLRYSRHLLLPQLDITGQQKLSECQVLVVGAGGLGSALLLYLAASGVGAIRIADGDEVEESNLQRQIIHRPETLGCNKALSAQQMLQGLNSDCQVTAITQYLDESSLMHWATDCQLVVMATDNLKSRHSANRVCLESGLPLLSGAAIGLTGQICFFDFDQRTRPCLACLYPHNPEAPVNCANSGVLAPLVGIIGAMMATESLKILAGFGETLAGKLLVFDANTLQSQVFKLTANPECPACCKSLEKG